MSSWDTATFNKFGDLVKQEENEAWDQHGSREAETEAEMNTSSKSHITPVLTLSEKDRLAQELEERHKEYYQEAPRVNVPAWAKTLFGSDSGAVQKRLKSTSESSEETTEPGIQTSSE